MNETERLKSLKAMVDSVEETSQGKLRGGFAVIGGGGADPFANDDDCKNIRCSNIRCNGNCYNGGCDNNSGCGNLECVSINGSCSNNACPTNPTSSPSSNLGLTFAL